MLFKRKQPDKNKITYTGKKTAWKQRDEEGKTSRKFTYDLFPKILSVLAAITLWYYVISVQSPVYEKSFSDIQVNLSELEESSGLSVISGYENAVDVILTGKKSDINKIRKNDITADVNLGGITHSGEYSLNISVKAPGSASIVKVQPSSVYVYIDKTSSRSVPVQVGIIGGTTDKSLVIDNPIPDLKNITITGPEEEILKVTAAKITADIGQISSSIDLRERLTLVDENGKEIKNPYVKMSVSEMKVEIPVYKYSTVPVKLKFTGIINANDITYTVEPKNFTIKGNADAVSAIKEISTVAIDETDINGEASFYVKLDLPSGVTPVSDTDTVYATIKLKNNQARVVTIDKIFTQNMPAGYNVTLKTKSVNVTLRGNPDYLWNYDTSLIYALVDLSTVSDTGTVKLPLMVKAAGSTDIYVYGDYSVEVDSKKTST